MSALAAVQPKPISGLFSRAYRDIMTDRARLPSMPDVAIRLRAAMQRDDHSPAIVARVVQADASTSAYLIRVANSPVYRGVKTVDDVETGIKRLGMRTTRNLVTAHAMRAMFSTRSEGLGKLMHDTWRLSARTAAFASILSRRYKIFEPDRAMLAGLLQDIGVLPLLRALENEKRYLTDAARLQPSIDKFAPRVGVALLKHWGLGDDLQEVARSRLDFARDVAPEADLADLVMVARALASVGDESGQEMLALEEIPAFTKLPLGDLTMEDTLRLLLSGDADVREMMQLLGVS